MTLHSISPEINIFSILTPLEKAALAHIKHQYPEYRFRIKLPRIRNEFSTGISGYYGGSWANLSQYAMDDWGVRCVLCKFDPSIIEIIK